MTFPKKEQVAQIDKAPTGRRKIRVSSTLELDEIKRIKVQAVKCPRCKLTLMVKPTDKDCPVCGGSLPKNGRN